MSALAARNNLTEGRYDLAPDDLLRIKRILHNDSGIQIADDHFAMVKCRLAKLLRESDMPNFAELIDHVEAPEGTVLRGKMISALTTNVTHFFREKHHFEHMKANVLSKPQGSFGPDGLRIWSAGCSNGSEPYSICMSILNNMKSPELEKARILGTDIDPNMIAHGQAGIYPKTDLEALGREVMLKHTLPAANDPDQRQMGGVARKMVTFRRLNLHEAWPMKKKFDVIFCRNVAIYFTEEARERLWMRYADALKPGGFLYIGHSERVRGPAQARFNNCASTTYQRLD